MPLSDLQRRKMERLFEVLDVDRDGLLEEADFTRRAEVYADLRGWDPESSRYREHLDFTRGEWESLRRFADRDADGSVNLREYLGFCDRFFRDGEAVEAFAYTDALLLFKAMDADDDGRITIDEYREYLAIYGLEAAVADAFFRAADLDGDGFLQGVEVIEAMREYMLGDDPDAVGNELYGPLP